MDKGLFHVGVPAGGEALGVEGHGPGLGGCGRNPRISSYLEASRLAPRRRQGDLAAVAPAPEPGLPGQFGLRRLPPGPAARAAAGQPLRGRAAPPRPGPNPTCRPEVLRRRPRRPPHGIAPPGHRWGAGRAYSPGRGSSRRRREEGEAVSSVGTAPPPRGGSGAPAPPPRAAGFSAASVELHPGSDRAHPGAGRSSPRVEGAVDGRSFK